MGAAFCYLLSKFVCHKLVRKYFPARLKTWQAQIAQHHGDMLWYIIFLRITPFLPNFFINIASPIVGVKLLPFFVGTFIGEDSVECGVVLWIIMDIHTLIPLLFRVPPSYPK